MALTAFRRIQAGQETTRGTPVAANKVIGGTLTMTPTISLHSPIDERNSLAEFKRDAVVAQGCELRYEGACTYQQLLDFLAMGVKGSVIPTNVSATGAKHDDNGVFADLTNALDDSDATEHTFTTFTAAEDKILVRAAAIFRAIYVKMGTTPNATSITISAVEVSDGASGWVAATLIKDGTSVGGVSGAQTGVVEISLPSTWASDTVDSDVGFWVRLTYSGDWTASVEWEDIYTIAEDSTHTYTPNLSSRNNQNSYTVEYGDDSQELESDHVMASSIELGIALGDVVNLTVDMFGQFPAKSSFTASLTEDALNEVVSNKLRVYVDTSWANLGNTEVATLVAGGTVRLTTGIVPVKYADGSLDFSDFTEQKRHMEIELEMVISTQAITEYDAWVAQTSRYLRLEWTGPTLGGGTHKLTIDMHGIYTENPEWFTDQDGENVIRMQLSSREDSSGNEFRVAIVTDVAAL